MLCIERAVVDPNPPFKSNGTIAVLSLALISAQFSLAGCAQAPVTRANADVASTTTSAQKPATCPRVEYPKEALRRGSQGTTTVRFLIDIDGRVAQSNILKSSGDLSLDEAALSGLSRCRFKPAVRDGQPQRAWVPVQYVWLLPPAERLQVPFPATPQP
ncbi:energy transducer TonB [Massilia aurea]|uniref:energy transducer TonB n=1 Tax=Massilia aurea TaxID=373040 RepID=UPI00216313B1|nr:energy transducer TonB [Massilia aurea]MCS0706467.1 energy transducer TonB [Massilia aurea]